MTQTNLPNGEERLKYQTAVANILVFLLRRIFVGFFKKDPGFGAILGSGRLPSCTLARSPVPGVSRGQSRTKR